MTSYLRRFCCAALLLAASVASGANAVPGMEVVALQGSSVVYRGITDGKGFFETGPLAPGIYTIEVRTMPNTPPTSARFFISLAGAKPLGDATIRPGVALAMNAMVRNPKGIRGQVSARGGIVYVPRPTLTPAPASASPAPKPTPLTRASAPRVTNQTTTNRPLAQTAQRPLPAQSPAQSVTVAPDSRPVPRPVGYQPRIINGRRYFWVPISAGSNLGRWLPETVARPVRTAAPIVSPSPRQLPAQSPAQSVAAAPDSNPVPRPASYHPKIINGRRYFWVPISAGSNLGRWLPDTVARPGRSTAPSASPSPRPVRR